MASAIKVILQGFCIGIANIIPGVSGGTMALLLGIYERLIVATTRLDLTLIKDLWSLLKRPRGLNQFLVEWQERDLVFLGKILVGAVIAILATSKLMTYLIQEWHDPTYGFFLGLIVISIITPIKMLNRFGLPELLSCLAACGCVLALTFSMSHAERLQSAKQKAELKEQSMREKGDGGEMQAHRGAAHSQAPHSFRELMFFFFAGSIAISAMILPGISGSFLLLVLGVYFDILAAIYQLNLPVILAVMAGCGFGLIAFSRILRFVFERFHDPTVAALIGLMVGSLVGVWPFRAYEIVGGKRLDLAYLLPDQDANFAITAMAFAAGCVVVLAFLAYENKNNTDR